MQDREQILRKLRAQIHINGHIIGVAAGGGMAAKYAVMGGADFILALSAGKFRQMGRGSYGCYLCYANSNALVKGLGEQELLPVMQEAPVLFGLNAGDPTIHLYEYIERLKASGFAGINNFPTVGIIDGQFREALEEEGVTFAREVEAIRFAHYLDLFTVAFVFDEHQAAEMTRAGADVVCAHFGLTKGGVMGAKNVLSLEHAKRLADRVFSACNSVRPDVIKMVYGGSASTPIDMQYIYQNTECMGYIGGSSFDRIPVERAILNTTKSFKSSGSFNPDDVMVKVLGGAGRSNDYVEFVVRYIDENYMRPVSLGELALVAHMSVSYLSTRFKREMGCSFTEYLVRYRMDRAAELIAKGSLPFGEVAALVGYQDYAQFSRMFKKYRGASPTQFSKTHLNTSADDVKSKREKIDT